MSYYSKRYKLSDVVVDVDLTEEQETKLKDLCRVADFMPATFYEKDHEITFTSFDEYDIIINFFKKVLNIVPEFEAEVEVEDTEEETYFMLLIKNGEIEECYGTVYWDTDEEREKIRKVLEARLQVEDPAILDDITAQIVAAIQGQYDDIDDEEDPGEENPEDGEESEKKDTEDDAPEPETLKTDTVPQNGASIAHKLFGGNVKVMKS